LPGYHLLRGCACLGELLHVDMCFAHNSGIAYQDRNQGPEAVVDRKRDRISSGFCYQVVPTQHPVCICARPPHSRPPCSGLTLGTFGSLLQWGGSLVYRARLPAESAAQAGLGPWLTDSSVVLKDEGRYFFAYPISSGDVVWTVGATGGAWPICRGRSC
jgi:hypothetical protein